MTALQLNADIYRNLGIIAEDETMLNRKGAEMQALLDIAKLKISSI